MWVPVSTFLVPSLFDDDADFGGRVVSVACVEGGSNAWGFGRILDGEIVIVSMDEAEAGDSRRRRIEKEKYDSDIYIVNNSHSIWKLSLLHYYNRVFV